MDAPSLFARLNRLNQPPTPPREHNDDKETCDAALAMLSSNLLPRPLNTPHTSPVSVSEGAAGSSDKCGKRVKFDSTPCNIEEVENIGSTPASEKSLAGNKPIRSILKRSGSLLSSDPLSSDPIAPAEERDFRTMLEDMMRGLASPEISPRFDAYFSINGCLKTYRDLPSQQALVEKISILTDYIRRDLTEVKASDSPRSSQLIAEALRFVNSLLWSEPTTKALPHSFQAFVLNHTIHAVSNHDTSKNLTQQYLHILATQEFGPKVMNKERANRVLAALLKIDSRFKSKSITAQKLGIHKQFLRQDQAKVLMTARANDWMAHLFKCLLSDIKEIRIRAIEFGVSAGLEIGVELLVSKAFRHLFETTNSNGDAGKTYAHHVMNTLNGWIDSKEQCMHIPHIWSIAVLFCRNKDRPFASWKHVPAWLRLIQRCFNSSDVKLRSQANQAWTHLIYTILPDEQTSQKASSLLLAPLESQMSRFKRLDQETKEARRITYAAYCTLLYYSLRPGTEFAILDRYWTEFVGPIMTKRSPKPLIEPDVAYRILSSLLGGNAGYTYDIDRTKKKAMLKLEEVPALDARWIRSRARTIVSVLDVLITDDCWWDANEAHGFLKIWNLFTKAIGQAGAKEVKTSNDTMGALGNVMTFLRHFLTEARTSKGDEEAFATFAILLQTAIENIGVQPFTERRLQHSVIPDAFDAITTSPGTFTKADDETSPILYLLDTLVSCDVDSVEESYVAALRLLVDTAVASNTSFILKVKKIKELASCLSWSTTHHSSSKAIFWDVVADRLEKVLGETRVGAIEDDTRSFGAALEEAVQILQYGIDHIHYNQSRSWFSALDALEYEFQAATGVAGSGMYLLEPLAKYLHGKLASNDIDDATELSCTIINKARWHNSPKDVERAWRSMYGFVPDFVKKSSSDIYEHLHSLIAELLLFTYSQSTSTSHLTAVLSAVRRFLDRCPERFFQNALKRVQSGLSVWMEDEKQLLDDNNTASKSVFKLVVGLWRTVLGKICGLEDFNTALLQSLAPSLRAGFSSRHRAIVNQSITMWNATFGLAARLEYPEDLRTILFRLSFITDLQLPGLCVQGDASQVDSTPLEFADTPEDIDQLSSMSAPPLKDGGLHVSSENVSKSIAKTEPGSRARTPEPSPLMKRKQAMNHTAPPRLRHDNSQIEFAAIDSSPSNLGAMESQLLTDRQKEVNERQHREAAAMFPDVRSSPKIAALIRRDSTPRLQLSQRDIIEASGGPKEPISPTLPSADKLTPFLGSSPTPSQRSSSSGGKPLGKPDAEPSAPVEIQIVDLAQDIPSSPPSVVARKVPESAPAKFEAPLAQDEDEDLGLHETDDEGQPEISGLPTNDAMTCTGEEGPDRKGSSPDVNSTNQYQTSSDYFVDAEMGEVLSDPFTQIPLLTNPLDIPEDVEMDEQLSNAHLTEESDDEPAEALDYSSDHSDLVNSQIARELESASQETIVLPSPKAIDSMPSSVVQKAPKKRGRPTKRKRGGGLASSQTAEEIYDSITVAQPGGLPYETGQRGGQSSGSSHLKTPAATPTETEQNSMSEADHVTSRPRKKSRRSSEVIPKSQSSTDKRHGRRSGPSRASPNPTSDANLQNSPSSSSQQPASVRSFLAVEVNSKRASSTPNQGEEESGSVIDPTHPTSEEQEDPQGGPPSNVAHASSSRSVTEILQELRETAQHGGLMVDLEAILDKAKADGIPTEQSAGVMRLSMELMQMAMNAMEGQKGIGGTWGERAGFERSKGG